MKCTYCGRNSADGSRFCRYCGKPFAGTAGNAGPSRSGNSSPAHDGNVRSSQGESSNPWQNGYATSSQDKNNGPAQDGFSRPSPGVNAASPQDAMEGILQRLSAHKMVLAIALAIVLVLILVPATCKKASSTSSTTSNYSAAYAEECPVAYRADFSQTSDPDAHGLVIQWKDRAPSAARIKVVFWDAYGDQLGTFDWSYSSAQDTSVTVTGTREASRATFYLYSVVLADSSWGTKNADDNTIANYGVKAVADLNSEAKSENYQSS